MWPAETEVMVSLLLSRVWQHVKLSDVSLGAHMRYSLVFDKVVMKPTKQRKRTSFIKGTSIKILFKIGLTSSAAKSKPWAG